jgi:hypothetical protein
MDRLSDQIDQARALMAGLSPAARARRGLHPTLGVMDLPWIFERFVVGHLEEHADQLDGLRTNEAPDSNADGPSEEQA